MTDNNLLSKPTSYYIQQIKDSDGLWSHRPDMAYDTILDASRSAHDYIGGCLQTADQIMQRSDHYAPSDFYDNRPDNIISYTIADHAGNPVFHNFIQHALADDAAIKDKTGYQKPFRIDCIWDAIGIWAHQSEADYETFTKASPGSMWGIRSRMITTGLRLPRSRLLKCMNRDPLWHL